MAAAGGHPARRSPLAMNGEPVSHRAAMPSTCSPTACSATQPLPSPCEGTDGRSRRRGPAPAAAAPPAGDIGKKFTSWACTLPDHAARRRRRSGRSGRAGRHQGRRSHRQRQRPAGGRLRPPSPSWCPPSRRRLTEARRRPSSAQADAAARHHGPGSPSEGQPTRWMIGISAPRAPEHGHAALRPARAFGASLQATWRNTAHTFNLIGKMLTGQASDQEPVRRHRHRPGSQRFGQPGLRVVPAASSRWCR